MDYTTIHLVKEEEESSERELKKGLGVQKHGRRLYIRTCTVIFEMI